MSQVWERADCGWSVHLQAHRAWAGGLRFSSFGVFKYGDNTESHGPLPPKMINTVYFTEKTLEQD